MAALAPAEAGQYHQRLVTGVAEFPQRRPEPRMGTHLHQMGHTCVEKLLRRFGEAHPAAQIRRPVSGVQFRAVQPPQVDGGELWSVCGAGSYRGQCLAKGGDDVVDLRAVRPVVDVDQAAEHPVGFQDLLQQQYRVGLSGEHARAGPVVHGQVDQPFEVPQRGLSLVWGEIDGQHPPAPGHLPEKVTASADHERGVVERESPGHGGGRDLPLAVTHDDVRPDAGVPPGGGEETDIAQSAG